MDILEENINLKNNLNKFFEDGNIEIADDVKEALEEVFSEFEFISLENDDVSIYFKDDLEEFESDLTLTNVLAIPVDGISSGVWNSTYTYYGDVNYVVNEKTDLVYQNKTVETLTDFGYENKTEVVDPNKWVITVLEKIDWHDGDYARVPKLYIYCPLKSPEN